jgi:hypothetical protein
MHLVTRANIVLRFHSTYAFSAATASTKSAEKTVDPVNPREVPTKNF